MADHDETSERITSWAAPAPARDEPTSTAAPPHPPLLEPPTPATSLSATLRLAHVDLPSPVGKLLDADGTAVVILRVDGTIASVNAAMLAILEADSLEDVREGSPSSGVLRSFLDHVPQELLHAGDGHWSGDIDHRTLDGNPKTFRATVSVESGEAASGTIALLLHDVTEDRLRVARLSRLASHDPLTGLSDRRRITTELATAIADQRNRSGHVAAIFVDLDRLRYVNDAFGHGVGDQLIASTAQRLSHAVRPTDRVARVGGDEFVVISTDIADAVSALDLAERIRQALTGHLTIGDLDLDLSVSVGLALTDADVLDLDDLGAATLLIGNADTAMRNAQQGGRGRPMLFTTHMRSASRDRTELAASLARAVTAEELSVEYQPVFSAVSKLAIGAEALVRWNHSTRGPMDTAAFIEIAEESGLIARLGEQVLTQALSDVRQWIDQDTVPVDFAVHVNVSRAQLGSASFVNLVVAKLGEHALQPSQLIIEVRATSLVGRSEDVERSIRALRRFGVRVAVDNFGTGPKALAVMTDVGADLLKLDGSFALPPGSSDGETRLVRAVVLVAHSLDMRVVAERVSGYEQLQRLQSAGCDMVQGNLLGPPRPANGFSVTSSVDW